MKIQVGVFFGGRSVEHEVSIISAMQAIAALDRDKYDAVPVYITKEGHFYTGEGFSDVTAYRDIPALLKQGARVLLASDGEQAALVRHPARKFGENTLARLDVALPVVHGTNVEDGTLQGLLDSLGLPYAGPDVLSSALCMDKAAAKTLLKEEGIPVLPWLTVWTHTYAADEAGVLEKIEQTFSYPVIVKPVNLGSSVGISKASGRESLRDALALAFQFARRVLVEPAVVSLREINCAVLGDVETARPSVCEEPAGSDEILSYKDKYLSNSKGGKASGGMSSLRRKIPADLSPELAATVETLAVQTFQTLGCRGVARVDFLLDEATGGLFVNEINTIPGSLAFYLWEPAGVPFPKLLDELISLAFARARERRGLSFSFETNILAGVTLGGKTGKLNGGRK